MRWVQVNNSEIISGLLWKDQHLYIYFVQNEVYVYEVAHDLYRALLHAADRGAFFWARFRKAGVRGHRLDAAARAALPPLVPPPRPPYREPTWGS